MYRTTPKIFTSAALLIALIALGLPATTLAATSATGTQSVTADIADTLEATFPAAYAWGNLNAGAAGNVSTEQVVNVKSNQSWGVKAATDEAGGLMREWNGAAYAGGKVLVNPLNWRLSSLGGTPQSTSFAAFTSTPALVTGGNTTFSDSGVDVGVKFSQLISYTDVAAGVTNDYRTLVTYQVAQGF